MASTVPKIQNGEHVLLPGRILDAHDKSHIEVQVFDQVIHLNSTDLVNWGIGGQGQSLAAMAVTAPAASGFPPSRSDPGSYSPGDAWYAQQLQAGLR